MEDSSEELFRLLNDSGKVAKLRKYIISFLISIEELTSDADICEDNGEETGRLIKNMEFYLKELTRLQKFADNIFLEMDQTRRQELYRDAPEVLRLFGWIDKINEAGEIVKKV